MNLEQMKLRLAAIVAKLGEIGQNGEITDDEVAEINSLNEEFTGLKSKIEALEKVENMTAAATTSTRKTAPAAKLEVGVDRATLDPKAGFATAGEFFRAVAQANPKNGGEVDKRLIIKSGHQEKIGEDGGFLVPVDFRTDIQKKVTGDESLLPRTSQFKTTSNNLVLPTSEVAPWDANGFQAYWEGEASKYKESKTKFGESSFRLHKLTAMVRATEELLDDAPALESWIKNQAPDAMLHKVNSAIISGSGAGMPLGFLNSGFKFMVAKESGQTADTVVFRNVNNMAGRILPASFARAVWLVNPAVLPQLPLMKFDDTATSPVPVYIPPSGVSGAPYGTLYGRPILPMMGGVKALGDEGDISLVDLSYYLTVAKTTGIKQDISTHVFFDTDEVAFKFTMRLAGQCPFKAPVTTENGNFSMSAFVTLADRA